MRAFECFSRRIGFPPPFPAGEPRMLSMWCLFRKPFSTTNSASPTCCVKGIYACEHLKRISQHARGGIVKSSMHEQADFIVFNPTRREITCRAAAAVGGSPLVSLCSISWPTHHSRRLLFLSASCLLPRPIPSKNAFVRFMAGPGKYCWKGERKILEL